MRPARAAGWGVVAGLCLAALVAIVALVGGDLDETDGRIIATSLGFSVFSAIGAPGAELFRRSDGARRTLGAAGVALAAAAFAALLPALWREEDGLWQIWGVIGLLSLGVSHACLVIGGRRAGDSPLVAALASTSLLLGALDATVSVLAVVEVLDEVDDQWARVFGATVVLLVLTTVLPPILRRLSPPAQAPPPVPFASTGRTALDRFAAEVEGAADRLEALSGPPQLAREVAELRRIAHDARSGG